MLFWSKTAFLFSLIVPSNLVEIKQQTVIFNISLPLSCDVATSSFLSDLIVRLENLRLLI